jgi:hypothetical protein
MGDHAWDRVRRTIYADADHCCEICGVHPDRLEAHEVWDYNDASLLQRLVRLMALCRQCHQVKHFARSRIHCTEEQIEVLIRHFMSVNGCDAKTLQAHYESEMAKWRERSTHDQWTVDWGPYSHFVVRATSHSSGHPRLTPE